MYKRLIDFLDRNNILTENQFGFRSGRSTIQATMLITDKIQRAIEEKFYSRCLQYFPAAILVYHGGTPIWRIHTGLCKFVQNNSTNILSLGQRTDLKLGEITSLLFSYNILFS